MLPLFLLSISFLLPKASYRSLNHVRSRKLGRWISDGRLKQATRTRNTPFVHYSASLYTLANPPQRAQNQAGCRGRTKLCKNRLQIGERGRQVRRHITPASKRRGENSVIERVQETKESISYMDSAKRRPCRARNKRRECCRRGCISESRKATE